MHVVVFVSGVLLIVSFIVVICSFILHFFHHFEFGSCYKIEWCCSNNNGQYHHNRRMSISPLERSGSTDRSSAQPPQTWGRRMSQRMSQRTSIAAAIVAEEVKQNNCCCCHVIKQSNISKDQLFCCLYSSVDHMEFYPLAVTLYFIILLSLILFISITLYYMYYEDYFNRYSYDTIRYNVGNKQIEQYCTIQDELNEVGNLDLYKKEPISNIRQENMNIYVTINYLLIIILILWESLLNWYRFYSTKFMSIKFTKPPYFKIFGFYSIYIILFLSLCITQIYLVFLLFPIIIIIHFVFNTYCINGFVLVLNTQYNHYVQDSRGISDLIINDLKNTMTKLKICAICCTLTSTLFLLTFTLCHYGDIVLLSAPLWWIINCICWCLTFAKNTIWFKHQYRNCKKKCCKQCNKNTKTNHKRTKSKEGKEIEIYRKNEKRPLSTLKEAEIESTTIPETQHQQQKQMRNIDLPSIPTQTPLFDTKSSVSAPAISTVDEKIDESMDGATNNYGIDGVVGSIQLPTIDDNKEYSNNDNSPISTTNNNYMGRRDIDKTDGMTPMSIIITPAGNNKNDARDNRGNSITYQQQRENRGNSVTYQYPVDYDDGDDDDDDDDDDQNEYFSFPDRKHNEEEMSLSRTASVTMTSKKPKALELLGVIDYDRNNEEASKSKTNTVKHTIKIEALHVPNSSAADVIDVPSDTDTSTVGRSQSARISAMTKPKQKDLYFPSADGGNNNNNNNIIENKNNNNNNNDDIDNLDVTISAHQRQISRTVTYNEQSANVWELMVHDGFIPSQTIQSLHELEDYTIAAQQQQLVLPRQRSSHL